MEWDTDWYYTAGGRSDENRRRSCDYWKLRICHDAVHECLWTCSDAKMYNLTDSEMEYITSSGSGHGLIYNGTDIIPFEDEFPTDTKLYNAMTTKVGEGETRQ